MILNEEGRAGGGSRSQCQERLSHKQHMEGLQDKSCPQVATMEQRGGKHDQRELERGWKGWCGLYFRVKLQLMILASQIGVSVRVPAPQLASNPVSC